jgi:hypothetical protein
MVKFSCTAAVGGHALPPLPVLPQLPQGFPDVYSLPLFPQSIVDALRAGDTNAVQSRTFRCRIVQILYDDLFGKVGK